MSKIKGFLIDLDGVIYNDTQPIPGSAETIQWLHKNKFPFRFITNTTMKSRETLQKKLESFGIKVNKNEIYSAAYAAAEYIRQSGKHKCHLVLLEDAQKEYDGLTITTDKPDYVVVGDLGEKVSFQTLNLAFQNLFAGAELIALQKNRYWLSDRGYTLDAGAFVALLEFASHKDGILIGKPSVPFFEMALKDLNLEADEVIMIGDDIETDIKGAQDLGIKTILVQTGKFLPEDIEREDIRPWATMKSIKDLKNFFKNSDL